MCADQFKRLLFQTKTVACMVCKEPKGHKNFMVFNEHTEPVYFCDCCSNASLERLAEYGMVLSGVTVDGDQRELTLRFMDWSTKFELDAVVLEQRLPPP